MKNKTIIYVTELVAFILCLVVTGCSNSLEEEANNGGFQFCVQMPKAIDVDTKASLGPASESIEISNAWIVQYSSPEEKLLKCVYIDANVVGSEFEQTDAEYLVTIKTKENDFSLTASKFYIILNGGTDLLKNFAEATDNSIQALSKITCPVSTNASGSLAITALPKLLTAGPTLYSPKSGDPEKVIFVSRVYRAFAKLSLNVKFPVASTDKLDIETATLTNIPKNMALFAGGGSNNNYPDISVNNVAMYTEAIELADVITNGGKKSFWMPENIRGTGSSLTFQGKNQVSNGPGGNLDGCTYLTIKGKYYYDKNQRPDGSYQDPIDVEYRFYLGTNLTNDYNIRRDHHYNLTVNLKGANSADLRVTITNGNVAVFDEVDTIENKVDF